MNEKPLLWVGSALNDLRAFTPNARREAGHQLHRVQTGLTPDDWKPMSSVAPGVQEIRIRTGREFRVFYVATYKEAVYVLHAFEKKTQKTRKTDIDLERERFAIVQRTRKRA